MGCQSLLDEQPIELFNQRLYLTLFQPMKRSVPTLGTSSLPYYNLVV